MHGRAGESVRLLPAPSGSTTGAVEGFDLAVEPAVRAFQQRRGLITEHCGTLRDGIAEGVVVAVKRLSLLGENDQLTGTFTFADLLKGEVTQAAL